eukprot:5841684-Amphidinium_carterae.2
MRTPHTETGADQKHVPQRLQGLGLKKRNAVKTSRVKLNAAEAEAVENSPLLDSGQANAFRSGTMRVAYLGRDRVDLRRHRRDCQVSHAGDAT